MIRVLYVVPCPIVFILFYDLHCQGGVLKPMKNDHFFSIFNRFGLFPQVFEQFDDSPILKFHEMIKVLHVVAFSVLFVQFHGRNWQGGVFKFVENDHFLNIFINFGLFPQDFGQVKEKLMLELHKLIRVSHIVAWSIVLLLFYEWG